MKVCDGAVQVMGGHGYVRDNMPELWFRNARAFATLEGMVNGIGGGPDDRF